MTERSLPWADTNVGDGSLSPYDNDEWSDVWRILFQTDRTAQGPIEDYENELEVTNPAGTNIQVDTGAALVDGKFYESDDAATTTFAIVAPLVATRIDRVVLRKLWAAQTVRAVVLTGVEGGGIPALTQVDGVQWEIPLAYYTITIGSVITLTDEREFSRTPLYGALEEPGFTEIETIIADGTASTIDFQNIPQTYKHLKIVGQGRVAGAVVQADLDLRFNNDSGANYNEQHTIGENAAASATAVTGQTEITLGDIPGASGIANHAGGIYLEIPDYVGETFFKTVLGQLISIPNVTLADFQVNEFGGLWEDTSAITRITLISGSGNFVSGSKYTLYGQA
jgi:hypothetical protein